MKSELDIYKQNRIQNLQNIYNGNISRLYSTLITNIKNNQLARFLSQNVKQTNINNLITQYNANVNILTTILKQRNITEPTLENVREAMDIAKKETPFVSPPAPPTQASIVPV